MARKLRDEIHAALRRVRCPSCDEGNPIGIIDAPEDVERWLHYAKLQCRKCHRFVEWMGFPTTDREESRSRRKSRRALRPTADSFCEICLRDATQLVPPDKLEVQHVVEKADWGADEDPSNLRHYCSMCHALTNLVRTYVSRRAA